MFSSNSYCDMTTDDGGWIVVQRNRKSSQLSFKNWREYEDGFGDLNNDFWVELKFIQTLIPTDQWEMIKRMTRPGPTSTTINSVLEVYPLTVGGFTGEGTDLFAYHNGVKFTTLDNDNDNKIITVQLSTRVDGGTQTATISISTYKHPIITTLVMPYSLR